MCDYFFSSILESNTSCCKLWWGLLGPKWPQSEIFHATAAVLHAVLRKHWRQTAPQKKGSNGKGHSLTTHNRLLPWGPRIFRRSNLVCRVISTIQKILQTLFMVMRIHLLWVLTLFQIGEWLLPDLSRHELFFWIDCCCMPEIRARSPFCWCSGYVWQYSMEVRWSDDFVFLQHLVICACLFVTGRHGRLFVPLQAPCSLQISSGRRQTHTKLTHYHIQGISGITRKTVTGHRMPLHSLSC